MDAPPSKVDAGKNGIKVGLGLFINLLYTTSPKRNDLLERGKRAVRELCSL